MSQQTRSPGEPKIENLRTLAQELPGDPEGLTSEEAEGVEGGLSNTTFRVNPLTFSSNATGIG